MVGRSVKGHEAGRAQLLLIILKKPPEKLLVFLAQTNGNGESGGRINYAHALQPHC